MYTILFFPFNVFNYIKSNNISYSCIDLHWYSFSKQSTKNFRRIPKEKHSSINEQIIQRKGKNIMKQHISNKLDRWGYKMFVLTGDASGICYIWSFILTKQISWIGILYKYRSQTLWKYATFDELQDLPFH